MDQAPYHRYAPPGKDKRALVHHVRSECSTGQRITDQHRQLGKDHRPKCAECTRLGRTHRPAR